jgi:hypothetical protein
MEAVVVVPRVDRLCGLRRDLDAQQVAEQELGAAAPAAFGDGQRGRQDRCRRMREQPVDAIRCNGELGVVVVVRVQVQAVQERREASRQPDRRPEDRGLGT